VSQAKMKIRGGEGLRAFERERLSPAISELCRSEGTFSAAAE
jgi:hypothetical protein